MKYGCIGEHLTHSFSKEIHNAISDYEYELKEVSRKNFDSFVKESDFFAVNVTIPYKELIIPYLFKVDGSAQDIGAVNTVVNRNGKLFGYNTDFYGITKLILHCGINLSEKTVAILGTGGTSKTAKAAALSLGAKCVYKVSRTEKTGAITYSELYQKAHQIDVIINTTPVGMYPNIYSSPLSLNRFPNLCGVIDVVYNPLRTRLVLDAKEKGIAAEGGLYMLVAQAVKASEYFLDKEYDSAIVDKIYLDILKRKENIVLTGMPGAGKSTVGKLVSKILGLEFIDTDTLIEKSAGKTISKIFEEDGERAFRHLENDIIRDASSKTGVVISTGGGAVTIDDNITSLKQNGRIFFIDRPLENIIPTSDRPLTPSRDLLERKYNERYPTYLKTSDIHIDGSADAESVAKDIVRNIKQ